MSKLQVSIDGKEFRGVECVPETSFYVGPPEATYLGEMHVFEQAGQFFICKADAKFIVGTKYEFKF